MAETLSKARNPTVEGLVDAGIIWPKAGKVRLLKREDLPTGWNPELDARLTVWESVQHLIRVLESEGAAAAKLHFVGRNVIKMESRTSLVSGDPQ